MAKAIEQIRSELAAPFSAADVDWRIQHTTQDKARGLVVPYVKSRAIQSRLDDVVGPYNWKAEYKPWHPVARSNQTTASQLCGISVYCEDRKEWIQKWDGAENTDIEPVKGGISDSFKRAAVLWGIGRYLYGLDGAWVDLEQKGKNPVIRDSEMQRLNRQYEKAMNLPPSNTMPFPGQQDPQPPAPPTAVPYDYAVRAAQPRQFASGNGMILQLQGRDGKRLEAYLQKEDRNLAEGVCLKNVKLTPFQANGVSCSIMDAYEVA